MTTASTASDAPTMSTASQMVAGGIFDTANSFTSSNECVDTTWRENASKYSTTVCSTSRQYGETNPILRTHKVPKSDMIAVIGLLTFTFGRTSWMSISTIFSPRWMLALVQANTIVSTVDGSVAAPFLMRCFKRPKVSTLNVSSERIRVK